MSIEKVTHQLQLCEHNYKINSEHVADLISVRRYNNHATTHWRSNHSPAHPLHGSITHSLLWRRVQPSAPPARPCHTQRQKHMQSSVSILIRTRIFISVYLSVCVKINGTRTLTLAHLPIGIVYGTTHFCLHYFLICDGEVSLQVLQLNRCTYILAFAVVVAGTLHGSNRATFVVPVASETRSGWWLWWYRFKSLLMLMRWERTSNQTCSAFCVRPFTTSCWPFLWDKIFWKFVRQFLHRQFHRFG